MTTKAREEGADIIIGVDYHPSFQTIAFLMEETGEYGEQELNHSDGEAERFYRELKERGVSVRVGLEATGYSRWFERLLVGFRGVDRRCRGDQEAASPQAENRSRGCPTLAEATAGKSLSANLGTESGES
jgi:hypothetical protein